jgi:hypothetical protein
MRKLMYLCYAIVLAGVFFFLSCQKENQTSDIQTSTPKSLLTASSREGNPFTDARVRVENGMLVFDNYKAFKEIQKGLKEMASNTELNRNLLVETGYNPDTDEDEELEKLPLHPVFKAFAQRFGIETEQQREEAEFKEYLKTDNNPDDFPDGCSYDPSFKALLNSQREVGVGNFIVKFFSMDKFALIYNRNLSVLEKVRSTSPEQLRNGYDLKIIDENNAITGANEIFSGESEGDRELTGGMCDVNFDAKSVNGNTFEFTNQSIGDLITACPNGVVFEWNFGDGVFVHSGIAEGPIQHTFTSDKYPYTITLKILCGDCAGKVFTKVIEKGSNPCDISNINVDAIVILGGNEIDFKISGTKTGDVFSIDFGDNTNETSTLTNSFPFTVQHAYIPETGPTGLTFPVTITINRQGCPSPIVINISVSTESCGFKNSKKTRAKQGFDKDNRLWQLSGAIWCHNNPFNGEEAGSSSQAYRFGKNQTFKFAKNVNFIYTDVQGMLVTNNQLFNNPGATVDICREVPIPLNDKSLTNDSYVKKDINLPTTIDQLRFKNNQLHSNHKMTLPDGTTKIEVLNLFLVN